MLCSAVLCSTGSALRVCTQSLAASHSRQSIGQQRSSVAHSAAHLPAVPTNHARTHSHDPPARRCGPCKMILPTLQQWAEELEDQIQIVKFNCNKHNKDLGISVRRPR